jgi:hypothetical protein
MAVRIMVLLAMIAGAAVAAYGLFIDKSGQQVAFATAGLFVLGVGLLIGGLLLGSSALAAGREGRGGKGLLLAFVGGMFLMAAAGALAGAVVFGVVVLF